MNAITIVGGLLALLGLLLFVRMLLGTFSALLKRRRYRAMARQAEGQGAYAGAVAARDVYVPWTITRRFALALLALLLAGVGGAIGGTGLLLARDYIHLDPDPSPIGTLQVEADGPGRLRIEYREDNHARACSDMPGSFVVVRGEFIQFDERLARGGLTVHQRVTTIESYLRTADVLINQPQALCDIHRSSQLWRPLEWLQKHQDLVTMRRYMSPPLGTGQHGLLAGRGGYLTSAEAE